MSTLFLTYNRLPPSSNRIYVKGRILTAEAREYGESFSEHMRDYLPKFMDINPASLYGLHLRFFMSNLLNETYGDMKLPPSKQAKDRYKRIDLDNRIKLITDCVRDAISVDDSHFFSGSQEKHYVRNELEERVDIYVQEVRPQDFGL